MIPRLFQKCLLRPGDLVPSREDLEVVGVFNPGVIAMDGEVVLMVRVAERTKERQAGKTALPRWSPREGVVIDWVSNDEIVQLDPRVVQFKATGLARLTFISHLRVIRSRDGRSIDSVDGPCFMPQTIIEEYGVEDPRITQVGAVYYFTYVAVSRHGAATALASTTDFSTFNRHGVIFCPENKDVVLFPEKIGGEYVVLHRPNAATPFTAPEIWLARSHDLIHWGKHEVLPVGVSRWDAGRIGAGAPPIRIQEGWLEIYHGSERSTAHGGLGAYAAGAMLLDPENPGKVIGRTNKPILSPQEPFEREGFMPDVVFPTGVVERNETLLVFYGAADTATAVVELSRDQILSLF